MITIYFVRSIFVLETTPTNMNPTNTPPPSCYCVSFAAPVAPLRFVILFFYKSTSYIESILLVVPSPGGENAFRKPHAEMLNKKKHKQMRKNTQKHYKTKAKKKTRKNVNIQIQYIWRWTWIWFLGLEWAGCPHTISTGIRNWTRVHERYPRYQIWFLTNSN